MGYTTEQEKTPNGGDYSEIYYRDAEGNATDAGHAVSCEIVEYKNSGEIVGRTYGKCTPGTSRNE